ncbi:hypothetical protein BD779DRAFT_1535348 [Infundibulicybe gibba]|nr:hypothetical protein BD779DRAFT_1535348 [Infundibulicybe gibba]
MLIHLACSDDMLPRSSRAADINRLLDPSYSSSSSSASSSSAHSHRAYVDHHGDLHDPDYRHFPAVSNKRHSSPFTARSHWAIDDIDEPEYADDAYLYRAPRRVASLTRYYSPSPSPPSESTLRSASPSASPFADDKQRWRWRTKGPASITSIVENDTDEYESEKQQQQQKPRTPSPVRTAADAEDDEDAEPHMEWTPTCTDSLRRHWQAISLRFRFGLFRAKRRMRNRVNSLL